MTQATQPSSRGAAGRRAAGRGAATGAALAALLAALLAAAAAPVGAAEGAGRRHRLDCLGDDPACPELRIEGDPWAVVPGFGPSPFRGYGDPSIRRDPASDRLWLSYSYLDLHRQPVPEFGVGIHLAYSDDQGASWRFARRLRRSRPLPDPAPPGGPGVSVHEVSTLAPLEIGSRVRWFGMHLSYFQPFGPEGRRPSSLLLDLTAGRSPRRLAVGEPARIGFPLTHPAWQPDLDLSSVHPELAGCTLWTEPALFGLEGTLYLVAQCLVIDPRTGARRPAEEFLGVFASDGRGAVGRLSWEWRGRLTTAADARALGGDVLTQPDVAWSRRGGLVLLVTPKRLDRTPSHRGCRALELESLAQPKLGRRASGRPIVRADVRSSDSTGLGPGLCAYDPASETGILFVRTEIDLTRPDIVFRLHATGIHP